MKTLFYAGAQRRGGVFEINAFATEAEREAGWAVASLRRPTYAMGIIACVCFLALASAHAQPWGYLLILSAGGQVVDPLRVGGLGELYAENVNKLNLMDTLNGNARESFIQWQAFEQTMGHDDALAPYFPAGQPAYSPEMAAAIASYAKALPQTVQAGYLRDYLLRQQERDQLLPAYQAKLQSRAKVASKRGLTLEELGAFQNELEEMKQDNRLVEIAAAAETNSLRALQREQQLSLRKYRLMQREVDTAAKR